MVFVGSRTAAWAQTPAAASLPIGTSLTIVSDETVDTRVRNGSEFRAHLRDPITLGDTLVATAGTAAKIVVLGREFGKDGTSIIFRIAIIGLNLGLAGTLPVRPETPTVEHIVLGMAIPVRTLAIVTIDEGKVRIAVPLPFKLSNEPPAAGYTPAPLRTANPILTPRRRPSRSRSPSPTPMPSATSTAASTGASASGTPASAPPTSDSPTPSATPTATPT